MKAHHLILFLTFLSVHLHAQYSPFFKDEFDSNQNNWFEGEIKKSTVQFYNGSYCVYNDWGKSPIVSLIDLPFDEKKNYIIKSEMEEGYIPPYGNGRYGVMFAAEDEKNGYAVLLSQDAVCYFVKIENGKVTELNRNPNTGGNLKGGVISIHLEDWQWEFKVDGTLMYSCPPMPWIGHKVGFYASGESGYSARNLLIVEGIPGAGPCPLPFTQEELNQALNKIICAAPDDFAAFTGNKSAGTENYDIWQPKDFTLNGTKDVFIAKKIAGTDEKKGKDFLLMFECAETTDERILESFFDRFRGAINQVKPSCGVLKQRDVEENLADFLLKSVIWDIAVKTPSGNVPVIVELDLNKFESGYFLNVHVNVPK